LGRNAQRRPGATRDSEDDVWQLNRRAIYKAE